MENIIKNIDIERILISLTKLDESIVGKTHLSSVYTRQKIK